MSSEINQDLELIVKDYKENIEIDFTDYDNLQHIVNDICIIYSHINDLDSDLNETISNQIFDLLLVKCYNPSYSEDDLKELTTKINFLKQIKQPEQRTPEWHTFRNNRLTASDLATALSKNKYCTRNKLIAKKCGYEEPFIVGAAIAHGVKYEDVAISIYEKRNNVTVDDYGCLPHPTIPYFGASPDGICDYTSENKNYIGRMLEIKCPKSRIITGIIPEHYELQVQGQLEVCELRYCDYLECSIKEYNNSQEFIEDSSNSISQTKNNQEKGLVIELYDIKKSKNIFHYLNTFNSLEDIETWEDSIIKTIFDDDNIDYLCTTYWYLEKYNCVLVERDIERFTKLKDDIKIFWDDVLKFREIGFETLIKKKEPKQKNNVTKPKQYNKKELTFLPDSS
jgi:putative phage-type endonuclease